MQDLTALACGDFLSALAGPAAAPGGGGVSALAGALGVALGNMVGSLTVGKPKYAAVEPEIRALNSQAESLRCQLEVLIQADAEAFAPVAAAYRMPRATPEQAAERRRPWKLPWRERVQCRCRSWNCLPGALPWQSNTPPKAVCWRYRMQGVRPFCARLRCAAAC